MYGVGGMLGNLNVRLTLWRRGGQHGQIILVAVYWMDAERNRLETWRPVERAFQKLKIGLIEDRTTTVGNVIERIVALQRCPHSRTCEHVTRFYDWNMVCFFQNSCRNLIPIVRH
jgi:hypothetical protein